MPGPATLFGISEDQVAGLGLALGVAAIIFFKLAIVRHLVSSQKVGSAGARVLYSLVAISSTSIVVIATLLFFLKD